MRHNREDYRDERNRNREEEPRWLHEQHHGHNSSRGNYTMDSNFNLGYGGAAEKDYGDQRTFNTNAAHDYNYPQGHYRPGGAQYNGEDYAANRRRRKDNPYGMTYTKDDGYNSGRHYDPSARYRNSNYDDLRRQGNPSEEYRRADERFGHDIRHGRDRDNEFMGHASPGDYESYRRYEMNNPAYDNDYSGGFAGRTHTEGRDHFGEDTYYSNLDRWQSENQSKRRTGGRERRSRS